uniref:hypothetical protein n=1 Tax=Sulfurihydrogenibium sp. TaxID=2053621 RepID=UPI002602800E
DKMDYILLLPVVSGSLFIFFLSYKNYQRNFKEFTRYFYQHKVVKQREFIETITIEISTT